MRAERKGCAIVFGYYVNDPERFGVMAFQVKPSACGELEITALNEMYLWDRLLDVQ